MNGSLKKSSKTLYGVCACIIVLMVICYFGVSNEKGTYSAYSCSIGHIDPNDTSLCYAECGYGTDSDSCLAYTDAGFNCNVKDTYTTYYCSKEADTTDLTTGVATGCSIGKFDPDNNICYTECVNSTNSKQCLTYTNAGFGCTIKKVDMAYYCTKEADYMAPACSGVYKGTCGSLTVTTTDPNYQSCTADDGFTYSYNLVKTVGTCTEDGGASSIDYYEYSINLKDCSDTLRGTCGDVEIYSIDDPNCADYQYEKKLEGKCVDSGADAVIHDYYKYSIYGMYVITFNNAEGTKVFSTCTTDGAGRIWSCDAIYDDACSEWSFDKFDGTNYNQSVAMSSSTASKYQFNGNSALYCFAGSSDPSSGIYVITFNNAEGTKVFSTCTTDGAGRIWSCDAIYDDACSEWSFNKFDGTNYNQTVAMSSSAASKYQFEGNTALYCFAGSSGSTTSPSTPSNNNPSSPHPSTPSSSTSSTPSSSNSTSTGPGFPNDSSVSSSSSSSNIDDNPGTGGVAIFMVWIIALGTLTYSFVYFKQSKFE